MTDVTVVVPVYRDLRIVQCLHALTSACSGRDVRIIVVDNDAEHPIDHALEEFPSVEYMLEPRRGSYFARNCGAKAASGAMLAFMDADCIPDGQWVHALMAGLERADAVAGPISKVKQETWVERLQHPLTLVEGLQKLPHLSHLPFAPAGNFAVRRCAFEAVGGFNPAFRSGGDVDFCWRLQMADFRLGYSPEMIVAHHSRSSLGAFATQYFRYGKGHVQLAAAHIKRRRFVHNPYQWRLLRAGFVAVALGIFGSRARQHSVLRGTLQIAEAVALICASLVGSIKHRFLYL